MVVYICENCKKEFNKKSNYLNHIGNKKKSCSQLKLNMHQNAPKCTKKATKCTEENYNFTDINKEKECNDTNKGYICNFCKTSFTRSTTLKRHLLERCKIRKEEIREKEAIFQELLQQNILLNLMNIIFI